MVPSLPAPGSIPDQGTNILQAAGLSQKNPTKKQNIAFLLMDPSREGCDLTGFALMALALHPSLRLSAVPDTHAHHLHL